MVTIKIQGDNIKMFFIKKFIEWLIENKTEIWLVVILAVASTILAHIFGLEDD